MKVKKILTNKTLYAIGYFMHKSLEKSGRAIGWGMKHKKELGIATLATTVAIYASHSKPDTHSASTVASIGTHALYPYDTQKANYVSPWGAGEIDWPSGFKLSSLGNDSHGNPIWKDVDTGMIVRQGRNNKASFKLGNNVCVVNFEKQTPAKDNPPTLRCEPKR